MHIGLKDTPVPHRSDDKTAGLPSEVLSTVSVSSTFLRERSYASLRRPFENFQAWDMLPRNAGSKVIPHGYMVFFLSHPTVVTTVCVLHLSLKEGNENSPENYCSPHNIFVSQVTLVSYYYVLNHTVLNVTARPPQSAAACESFKTTLMQLPMNAPNGVLTMRRSGSAPVSTLKYLLAALCHPVGNFSSSRSNSTGHKVATY